MLITITMTITFIQVVFWINQYNHIYEYFLLTVLIKNSMTITFREFPAPGRRRLELETSITCTDGSKRTVPRWRSTSSTSSMPSSLPLLSSPSSSSMMLSLSSATVYVIIASTIILIFIVAVIIKSVAYHSHPPRPPFPFFVPCWIMALLEMKTFVASPEIDSWQDLAVRFRLNFWLSTRAISANLYNDNGDDEDDDDVEIMTMMMTIKMTMMVMTMTITMMTLMIDITHMGPEGVLNWKKNTQFFCWCQIVTNCARIPKM